MDEIITSIRAVLPGAELTLDDVQLPFPPAVDSTDFARVVGDVERYPLDAGVADTIERFQALIAAGAEIVPQR